LVSLLALDQYELSEDLDVAHDTVVPAASLPHVLQVALLVEHGLEAPRPTALGQVGIVVGC